MRRVEDGRAVVARSIRRSTPSSPTSTARTSSATYLAQGSREASCRQVPARELYAKMMRTLAQTGNGWMTFKDASNLKCNQTGAPGQTVHLSNLCTEIIEVTSKDETAVLQPRLDQPRQARPRRSSRRARLRLRAPRRDRAHRGEVPRPRDRHQLLPDARRRRLEPRLASGGPRARWACRTSSSSSGCRSIHPRPASSRRASRKTSTTTLSRPRVTWREPRDRTRASFMTRAAHGRAAVRPVGRRARGRRRAGTSCRRASRSTACATRSLLAIAPTATISSIAGCYECIEPQLSNLFKRETLSGDFLVDQPLPRRRPRAARPLDRARSASSSSAPRARSRTSRRSPRTCACSTAPRGSSRCAP